NRHAFIRAQTAGSGKEVALQDAEWATLEARFGVEPIFVKDFGDIPNRIRDLAKTPGPYVRQAVERCVSTDPKELSVAHKDVLKMGRVGQRQVAAELLGRLAGCRDLRAKSELFYSLGLVISFADQGAEILLKEIRACNDEFSKAPENDIAECIAHALLAVRK